MQATEAIAAAAPEAEASTLDESSSSPAASDWFGASGARVAQNETVNSFMRNLMGAPTREPSESIPAEEPAPTATGDVKPAGQGEQARAEKPPRRGVPKVISAQEQEIETLKAQLAERDPAKLREQILAEQQATQTTSAEQAHLAEMARTRQEEVAKYRRLVEVPDSQLSNEDYTWREGMKERLAQFPDVRAFYEQDAETRVSQAEQAHVSGLRSSLSRHVGYAGVDQDAFKKLNDWGALGDHLYEAGKKAQQPELDKRDARIRELEGDLRQLRVSGTRGIGAAREPSQGGRSAASMPVDGGTFLNNFMRGRG